MLFLLHSDSCSKLIKMISRQYDNILFIHPCVISFLTNQLAVFLRTATTCGFFIFSCIVRILYNKKKITWSLGDTKFLFLVLKIFYLFAALTHEIFFNTQREISYAPTGATRHDDDDEREISFLFSLAGQYLLRYLIKQNKLN